MGTVRRLLRPDWRKASVFSGFVIVTLGGWIQTWAFAEPPLPPKPFLYDLLAPLPLWPIWVITLVPLALLTSPLRLVGVDVMTAPAWLFVPLSLLYYYFLSCFLGLVAQSAQCAIRRLERGATSGGAGA